MSDQIEQLWETGLHIYVLIDGARVEAVDKVLEANEVKSRSVFRGPNRDVVLAGPWLINAGPDRADIERALAVAHACRGGVCWAANCNEDNFIRHARVLNVARLPDERIVWFRHYDPDVLAFLIPLFDAEQAARLFGPASVISFIGGRGTGKSVIRPEDLPDARTGPLTFTERQMVAIEDRQRGISRSKIADALREAFPEWTARKSSEELMRDVEHHDLDAARAGITSERGVFQWAQLSILTGGRINQDDTMKAYIQSDGMMHVDRTLNRHFDDLISQARFTNSRDRLY